MTFELRDLLADPLTPDELWRLMHDAAGRQLGPLTKIGNGVVMGFDPVRLGEYLEQFPEARERGVTVYGRPDDAGTRTMLEHLAGLGVPATLADVGQQPLSRDELWQLMEIPGSNIRTPFVEIDGAVVLGNDRRRLEEVLTQRG